MYVIRPAEPQDANGINEVIHRSFRLYADELKGNILVKALIEPNEKVAEDIARHCVFVAEDEKKIIGSIRYQKLTADLAYIYRFGVDPDVNNMGVGSDLLNCVIEECTNLGCKAIALHTNSRYYKLARYYYGKQFYVHSTTFDKGYIRALFVKDLSDEPVDVSPAFPL